MDAMADGMTAGHLAARAAIKAHRPDLPAGFSLAIVDDRVQGDDPRARDRKRSEVYERWLDLARTDDFVGVQNYDQLTYDADGVVRPPAGAPMDLRVRVPLRLARGRPGDLRPHPETERQDVRRPGRGLPGGPGEVTCGRPVHGVARERVAIERPGTSASSMFVG
ncbi:hypothetical protein [Actinoplanes philippinensis]|uniref:hypothetical protein n=1 Tax=Actinoplanes philippinensis TaxID=35752 RepID=UPI00340144BB